MGNPFNLTVEQAGDIAITAAEGGIGYWGRIDSYQPSRWMASTGENRHVGLDFVFYTQREWNDDTQSYDAAVIDVTPALIKRGWRLAVSEYRHVLDLDDPSCTDSIGADVVIQLGAFGKVVYG